MVRCAPLRYGEDEPLVRETLGAAIALRGGASYAANDLGLFNQVSHKCQRVVDD